MELHSAFKEVVAYVEVRTGNDNRSAAIAQELRYLGARVEPTFTDAVTHVVFKEGLKRTWNKAMKKKVHLVSVSWIDRIAYFHYYSCKQNQMQMPEKEFAAVRPEEISSPLPRINQPVRWKKMKSMQPCDFDEELARSAERGEKKRRRMMANKFVLSEEVTPTTSSPIPVLAFDTQARSPIPTAFTRMNMNSPIPDTPPSMQERLERMRREQRQVLDLNLDHSPPTTPKAPIDSVLQRRLYDLFTMDIISTGSSNEDDEAASKTITEIIHSLGSSSEYDSQPSADKKEIPVLASDKSDLCLLKNSDPKTQIAVLVSSNPLSNQTCETSQTSKAVSVSSNQRAARISRRSCVYNTSNNSSMNLDQNISDIDKSRSLKNSENKSRRSETLGGRCSRGSRRMSLNALSPKDLNIDTPPLNVKSLDLQESLEEARRGGKTGTVNHSGNCEGSFRSGRRLLKAVSEVDSDKCEKVAIAESVDNMESNIGPVRAQLLGQRRATRLSGRLSLISEMSKSPSLISKDLNQPSLISQMLNQPSLISIENAKGGFSPGFESKNGCVSTRACLVESDQQNNKTTISSSSMFQGSTKTTDSAASESSTALKVARKKRNLLAGTTSAGFLLCSLEASSRQRSPEAESSHKSRTQTVVSNIKSDISFMFGFKSHDTTTTTTDDRKNKRRSTLGNKKFSQVSVDGRSGSHQNTIDYSSKNMPADDNSMCKTAIECSSLSSHGQQNQSSFGDSMLKGEMSMSMAYGHDSSSIITRVGTSRRSLEEFRTNTKTTSKDRKPSRLSTVKPKPTKTSNGSQNRNETKDKFMKPNGHTRHNKRSSSPSDSSASRMSAKRRKGSDRLPATDVDSTLSESSLAEDDQVPARLRHANSLLMEQKRQAPSKRLSHSLVVTSLHRDEQETVYSIVKSLGVFRTTNNVEPTTTHVVCGESRRTLNLLKAIASGCWLLKKEWVMQSLETGTWLQEELYEMSDIPAAVKSRCDRQKVGPSYKVDLFSKCSPIFVPSSCTPPRQEMVHLINLCCGQVTSSESRAAIHLGDDHNPRKPVIKPSWVLDCIMKLETLPTNDYIVLPKTLVSHRESSPEF